jgi:hypothetical protein
LQLHSTFPTAFGPRLAAHPCRPPIPTAPAAALRFARDLDRQADFLLSEGKHAAADRLAHLAFELRARIAGGGGAGR